ncbi:hypothetical protein E4U27_001224 [Claviceps purpurea]|nr:hypothetical protein E4U27_001224 [Claviceps purpurea]KAG6184939.1 hypothetical protein E4U36_001617 [Claviceps purpurea]
MEAVGLQIILAPAATYDVRTDITIPAIVSRGPDLIRPRRQCLSSLFCCFSLQTLHPPGSRRPGPRRPIVSGEIEAPSPESEAQQGASAYTASSLGTSLALTLDPRLLSPLVWMPSVRLLEKSQKTQETVLRLSPKFLAPETMGATWA